MQDEATGGEFANGIAFRTVEVVNTHGSGISLDLALHAHPGELILLDPAVATHLLAGHVPIIGSLMSDATLVRAAVEVAALLRREILSRSLPVVTASESKTDLSVAARRIDLVMDLVN